MEWKFELPEGSYSVSDIQDYFEYIIKIHETVTDNPPTKMYINKIENGITLKIKKGYNLQLLMPETMKLLGISKNKIAKNENGENMSYLKIGRVVLVHSNLINYDY